MAFMSAPAAWASNYAQDDDKCYSYCKDDKDKDDKDKKHHY
jgi:hypothetical protein